MTVIFVLISEVLETKGTVYEKGNQKVKHYKNFKACEHCSILEVNVPKQKMERLVERSIYQEVLEGNKQRVLC